jgi:adenosylcobinamide-GDP ribazoletransferase
MRIVRDIVTAVLFCTRLPIWRAPAIAGADLARASWAFPIAGLLVGLIAAAAYWLARRAGLPPLPAAALTLTATLLATGCLHEDGLADVADSFGGATRERKLAIMRDSSIGAYGTCALIVSLLLRVSALSAIADPVLAAPILVAAHVAARATMSAFMVLVPPARADGLSAGAGRPSAASAVIGAMFGVLALAIGLGPVAGIIALVVTAALAGLLGWFCLRQIGGQTGDVLGALEQFCEIAILLAAASIQAG